MKEMGDETRRRAKNMWKRGIQERRNNRRDEKEEGKHGREQGNMRMDWRRESNGGDEEDGWKHGEEMRGGARKMVAKKEDRSGR